MAKFVLNNLDVKVVDFSDTKSSFSVFGQVQQVDFNEIEEVITAQSAWTGMAVIGKNERYVYDDLDSIIVEPSASKKLVSGELLVERENAGFVYISGKFPADSADLNLILDDMLTGTKTIGGAVINSIRPQLRANNIRTRS
ncbi:hypothetical protein NRK67_02515 [Fusobacteria bacterium ZRK30]|nr:hypothetical protein NRK67_02515 [Fusobacteria bacterium ZRK30]